MLERTCNVLVRFIAGTSVLFSPFQNGEVAHFGCADTDLFVPAAAIFSEPPQDVQVSFKSRQGTSESIPRASMLSGPLQSGQMSSSGCVSAGR